MEALKTEKVQGMLQHYLNTTRPSSDDPNSPTTDSMDREHYVFEAYYDDLYGRGRWLRRLWEICYAHEPPSQNWELARAKPIDQEWTAFKQSKGIDLSDKIVHYSADF